MVMHIKRLFSFFNQKTYMLREIQLVDGDLVLLDNLPSDAFRICVIAHSLSNLCRYTGHTYRFYSVAQHSVLVSYQLPKELQLAGLLHDIGEAFVGDMASPVKKDMPKFKQLEAKIVDRLCEVTHLPITVEMLEHDEVRNADYRMLATEKKFLMNKYKENTWSFLKSQNIEPYEDHPVIDPLLPEQAYLLFMNRFNELTGHEHKIRMFTQEQPYYTGHEDNAKRFFLSE